MRSFGYLIRAEWTKLWSVRRWVLGLLAAVPLTLGLSLFSAAGSGTDLNDHPEELGVVGPEGQRVRDELHFVYQPLAGDGSLTVQVLSQTSEAPLPDDPGRVRVHGREAAMAGLMLRESGEPGSRYAAVMLTLDQGVRFQANYTFARAGTAAGAPHWLRLVRTGGLVTGYESADGASWTEVDAVDLAGLPATVEIGMFVNSPDVAIVERFVGGSSVGVGPTRSTARFGDVQAEPVPTGSGWLSRDTSTGYLGGEPATESAGVVTVTGSGELGPNPPDDDVVQLSLIGILLGHLAVGAVGALFMTAEHKRGMIRTTLAASPRRGRVLAAKAVVLGTATLVVGVLASLTTFLVTQPVLRRSGFGPPGYPVPSLSDGPVLRAVLGAGAVLALVAVFGLGLGAVLRRTAPAVTAVVLAFVPVVLVVDAVPLAAAQWLARGTPIAGMSVLQTLDNDHATAIEFWKMTPPWAGLGVLAGYAAAALLAGAWLLRRRDA